jgi:hypothetical protein
VGSGSCDARKTSHSWALSQRSQHSQLFANFVPRAAESAAAVPTALQPPEVAHSLANPLNRTISLINSTVASDGTPPARSFPLIRPASLSAPSHIIEHHIQRRTARRRNGHLTLGRCLVGRSFASSCTLPFTAAHFDFFIIIDLIFF